MSFMFNESFVEKIYVSNLWNTDSVSESDSMFYHSIVVGQNGTKAYDSCSIENDEVKCTGASVNPTNVTYARVDNVPSEPGYLTYKDAPNSKCYEKNGVNYWGDFSKDNTYNLINNVNNKTSC